MKSLIGKVIFALTFPIGDSGSCVYSGDFCPSGFGRANGCVNISCSGNYHDTWCGEIWLD